jgi:transcriptional regulator with XRE-family HTH domain
VHKSIHTDQQQLFQELLKQVRLEAGLTQVELAKKLNTSHSRISDYERGGRRLDMVQMKKYCEALGITLREFVDRFEEMTK